MRGHEITTASGQVFFGAGRVKVLIYVEHFSCINHTLQRARLIKKFDSFHALEGSFLLKCVLILMIWTVSCGVTVVFI